MDEGDLKELRELVEFLKASGIAEFDMERPDLKVRLKFAGEPAPAAPAAATGIDLTALAQLMGAGSGFAAAGTGTPAVEASGVPASPASAVAEISAAAADDEAGLHIVKSPLVGTFYDAPSPGSPAFVKVGDTVGVGTVLCIVEAMKIMNEIESDAAGEIVKVYARPGQPVEYGQRLFGIRA